MEYHKGFEHCSLVVYTGKMFLGCDLVGLLIAPQWRDQWFSLDFFSGFSTLLMTEPYIFFIGDWRSQPKPSFWEGPAFWGRGKIRILNYTADCFTSSQAIYEIVTLTNQDIMKNFCLGFCNTAQLEVRQESTGYSHFAFEQFWWPHVTTKSLCSKIP